jgi:hypothetical protein
MSIEKPSKRIREKTLAGSLIEEIGKIKFDRSPTSIATDPEYLEKLPEISELYKGVELWHGTGRYKYSDGGDVVDILDGIIRDGGLIPHQDDWDRKRGTVHTISTAPSRMYARLYAGMYAPAATRIRNELGSRELWGYYFLGTSAIVGLLEYRTNIRKVGRGDDSTSFIPGINEKSNKWVDKVTVQDHSLKDVFLYGTDIAENYPILIGVKKGTVQPTHGSKFINLHERRSETPIQMNDISDLEVPRDHVEDTKAVLAHAGYPDVKILPIEFGEEYCRKFSFRKLVSGRPLAVDS